MGAGLAIDISRTNETGLTETVTNGQIIDSFITGTTTETPNILNQIISRTAQGQTKNYLYDLDGNMATGFTPEGYPIAMTYDAQNRMKSAEYTDSNNIVHRNEYSYAGDSLFAEVMKFDEGTLTGTTRYLRSGFLPMQERDASDLVTREYTWGLNLGGGIGGLLNLKQGGADYSYLYDGKGNVAALIDSSQSVVASYAYDPFGKLMSKSGTLDQPYTFSTKEYDSRTGLSYYGFRFYDSCTGKWTARDPLEEEGGINLYGFVGNDPINQIDPDGLEPQGGERGRSGGLGGKNSNKPWKHCQEYNPPDPRFVRCRDQHGQWKKKQRPPEMPFPNPEEPKRKCGEECKNKVATVVVTAAGTYVVYRCIRMLPSLFPPLWPTIPVNAAIP